MRKYPDWGRFLKKYRADRYRSAREFCSRVDVGISYPQYSRYEAGDQLPNLEQALRLFELLNIPALEGVLEWCLAQARSGESRSASGATLLREALNSYRASSEGRGDEGRSLKQPGNTLTHPADVAMFPKVGSIPLDDLIVFNQSHLSVFQSDAVYRDLFTYVNAYAPDWITVQELASAVNRSIEQVRAMMKKLCEMGVVTANEAVADQFQAAKKNFYFPDDSAFFPLRNRNVSHDVSKILEGLTHADLSQRRAFRGVVTRELTQSQVESVLQVLDRLTSYVVGLPETEHPDKIYSLCLVLGSRFDRSQVLGRSGKVRPGLTSSSQEHERDVSFSAPRLSV